MNLQFIKYFIVLAETKNFTKAAEKMYVVQSTFSSGIKKLEEHLDCQLFYRDKRNVNLTPEGSALLPKAKKLLSQWNVIESEFTNTDQKILHVGILNNIFFDAIIPNFKSFQELYSQYQVQITEENKDSLLEMLQKEKLDGVYIENEPIDENIFENKMVYEEKLDVALPLNHPLALKNQLNLKALNGLPFIERCNCSLFNEVEEAFTENDIKTIPVFKANNDDTVTSLISSGIGISLLAKPSKPVEGIKFIPLNDADFKRQIIFVWKKDRISKALQNFLSV